MTSLFGGIAPGLFSQISASVAAERAAMCDREAIRGAIAFAAERSGVPFDNIVSDLLARPIDVAELARSRSGWAVLAALFFSPDDLLPSEH